MAASWLAMRSDSVKRSVANDN